MNCLSRPIRTLRNPVVIKIGDYALNSNVWECDVSLDYQTTYYWKIRAITASTHSTWSSTGVFTTLEQPSSAADKTGKIPEVRLLDDQEKAPPPATQDKAIQPVPSATQIIPSPAPAVPPAVPTVMPANQLMEIPNWMLYFIGGLIAIVMLALLIVLAVVLKIKRF